VQGSRWLDLVQGIQENNQMQRDRRTQGVGPGTKGAGSWTRYKGARVGPGTGDRELCLDQWSRGPDIVEESEGRDPVEGAYIRPGEREQVQGGM
jgi:hypothetical protein